MWCEERPERIRWASGPGENIEYDMLYHHIGRASQFPDAGRCG